MIAGRRSSMRRSRPRNSETGGFFTEPEHAEVGDREDGISTEPSYVGLMNAVAQQEWHAYGYVTRCSDQTSDVAMAPVLRRAAARGAEDTMAFARRVDEFGYGLVEHPVAQITALGYAEAWDARSPDVFDAMFRDHTIDPVTGALLGRFIAEEGDSESLRHPCRAGASGSDDTRTGEA